MQILTWVRGTQKMRARLLPHATDIDGLRTMCGAVIFRKFWVFLTRAGGAAVAFSSKCRWHFKLGTQRLDLDIRIKLRMKNHANFDVSSRNSKNARKAPPARDRYWRVAHNVRSGNFSKILSIFDACPWSGDRFFIKMSLTLQIGNSTHRSGHQD